MNEKANEKDKKSELEGLKVAYYYTIIFLLVWILIGLFTGESSKGALYLLLTQNIIFLVVKSYYKKFIL